MHELSPYKGFQWRIKLGVAKYFRLCGLCSLYSNYSCHCSKSCHRHYTKEWAWLSMFQWNFSYTSSNWQIWLPGCSLPTPELNNISHDNRNNSLLSTKLPFEYQMLLLQPQRFWTQNRLSMSILWTVGQIMVVNSVGSEDHHCITQKWSVCCWILNILDSFQSFFFFFDWLIL